ncbi:hypothetical protein PFNF135_00969 [Plasmodium falciparum NF135/5.C10]|uniref:Duffy-binding-like domain-containing protein n=1 Tax=Plasmodium falciparum NF135/5.C10 TaxID=1036726 RepID=W4ILR1_PLAFA|nr:hypothetical protein PFNF135_00969 [Plasmodium falciparum NF135/5.C10]
MLPQGGGGRGGDGGTQDEDAKHAFDRIGEKVHEEVTRKAIQYNNYLHGVLSNVNFSNNEIIDTTKPCLLDHNKHTTVSWGVINPCANRQTVRFSDDGRSQCSTSRITGNNSNTGACAPYRKLQLCDYNLEKITDTYTTTTHNLLVDVLLAAKYEGQSITQDYPKYQAQYDADNPDFNTTICTVLARSFADIGDIIRGKDLYVGNRKEREKEELQKNLKDIFKKIYDNLVKNKEDAKGHYGSDENYYKLREDWWEANRAKVWEAITCHAGESDKYFRRTCGSGNNASPTQGKCRCKTNVVPTYFDYVPQFLRWFEEWAEDFCRKKKKKLPNVKTNCRGNYKGQQRYCSRNGYDCEKTKRAIGKLRYGNRCIDCLYACNPYVEWMDNKKKEFEKQKKKCEIQIFQNNEPKVSAYDKINNLYYDYFYKELKQKYSSIEEFLRLLNQDAKCKNLKEYDSESEIDFNNSTTTFSGSQYCQPCPLCGVKHKGGNEWEERKENDKCNIKLYRPKDDQHGTTITILKSGEKQKEIEKKLNAFCNQTSGSSVVGSGDCGGNSDPSLCEPWQCYQSDQLEKVGEGKDDEDDHDYENEVKDAGGLCILPNPKKNKEKSEANSQNEPAEFQKTYNDFFNFWVAHMLKDSIHWKKKLDKCINNTNGKTMKCRNGCNNDCECFKKWIKQKKEEEWKKIKNHFKTQEAFKNGGENVANDMLSGLMKSADFVLEGVLELQFLNENTEEKSENSLDSEEIQHLKQIKKILDEEKQKSKEEPAGGSGIGSATGKKTIMDKLIEHEEGEAEKCKKTQEECERQKQQQQQKQPTGGPGRAAVPSRDTARGPTVGAEDDSDESGSEEEEEEEEEEGGGDHQQQQEEEEKQAEEEEKVKDSATAETPQQEDPKVCETVKSALKLENLKEACSLKYGPKAPTSWKCIPSGGDKTATSSESGLRRSRREAPGAEPPTKSGATTGGLCIPPRRRRLYVGKLQEWANSDETLHGGESSPGGEKSPVSGETTRGPTSPPSSNLRDVDGLRDAFIESAAIETFFLWHKFKMDKEREDIEKNGQDKVAYTSPEPDKLDKKLKEGKIDDEFKRQMFYTLGDYRDILFGKDISNNMDTINQNISAVFSDNGGKNSAGKDRENWWKEYGPHIWNGMLCALSYDNKTQQIEEKLREKLTKKDRNDYKYDNVSFSGGFNGDTKLDDFVKIPTYFRYLEEWGEEFCRKRIHKLDIIEKDCRGKNGGKVCSGYGENCDDQLDADPSTVPSLKCQSCGEECRKYKKWIEKKKMEYEKQKNAYKQQKQDAESNNGFCATLTTYTEAKDFLKTLGPCSKKDDDSGNGKTLFKDIDKTFGHENYCGPCSEFKIDFTKAKCTGDEEKRKCNGKNKNSIDAKDIQNKTDANGNIEMRVSDNTESGKEFKDLDACRGAGIFKRIRKDEWTCEKVCGYVVCKPKTSDGEKVDGKPNGENPIITITALVTHWVQNFLEDYNKIKKKLNPCTKNDQESTCIKDCVEKWVQQKRKEWDKIKNLLNEQYKGDNAEMDPSVRSSLVDLIEGFAPKIDKGRHKGSVSLVKLFKCNCDKKSENSGGNDPVKCLLEKLKDKIGECKDQTNVEKQASCDSTLVEDDDEPFEEENENPVGKQQPSFCPEIKSEQEEEGDKCEPAAPVPPAPEPPADSGEQTPILKPEEEAPSPADTPPSTPAAPKLPEQPKKPRIKTRNVLEHPAVIPALVTSTLAWSVGIGFAAFTYFYLKVLYIYIYMWGCMWIKK